MWAWCESARRLLMSLSVCFVQHKHGTAATARASFFHTSGPHGGVSRWYLIDSAARLLFVEMLSHHVLILNAAEGFWLLRLCVGWLHRVTGRLETALDAAPEGRYLAGFYMPPLSSLRLLLSLCGCGAAGSVSRWKRSLKIKIVLFWL